MISLQSKGLSRVFSNITVQKHQFFCAQLSLWSNSYIHTRLLEKPVLTTLTFVSKVISLLFNTLSRFATAFLPRSRCLLISWLRLPSAGIVKVKPLGHVQLFMTPWTLTQQAPPSLGFSRQEYWRVLPFPSPGDLPHPGIEPGSLALQAHSTV